MDREHLKPLISPSPVVAAATGAHHRCTGAARGAPGPYHHPAAYTNNSLSLVSGPGLSRGGSSQIISCTGHAGNALFIHFKCRLAHRNAAISSQLRWQLGVPGCLTRKHLNTEPGPCDLWGARKNTEP